VKRLIVRIAANMLPLSLLKLAGFRYFEAFQES